MAHYVGNVGAPRLCEVCGQEHPRRARWLAPVEFRIGPDGRADEMISVELERLVLERTR